MRRNSPPTSCRHDHAGVAAGAEQQAPREGDDGGAQVRRVLAALLDQRLAEGAVGRLEGQEQVGAGVTVGDRVDVEGVDLLAGVAERLQHKAPRTAPGAAGRSPQASPACASG